MKPFRYLADPVFLAAVGLYLLNRLVIKSTSLGQLTFFRDYFNDFLCIPFWLPPMLWLQRRLGVRHHDGMPRFGEIAPVLLLWSVFFEIVGPRMAMFGSSTADPADVFFYVLGAVTATFAWGLYVRPGPEEELRAEAP